MSVRVGQKRMRGGENAKHEFGKWPESRITHGERSTVHVSVYI